MPRAAAAAAPAPGELTALIHGGPAGGTLKPQLREPRACHG